MSTPRRSLAWWVIWIGAVALFFLHQDFWFWNDQRLVLGFLPIGLAYHVGYSIVASLLWFAAIRFAWPRHLERWADVVQPTPSPTRSRPKA